MPMERVRLGSDRSQVVAPTQRADRPMPGVSKDLFRQQLAQATGSQFNDRVDQALQEIDQLGAQLAASVSLPDLKRYRQAVAALVREITDHMVHVKTQMEWDAHSWEHRTMVILQKVDEGLEKLAGMVLSQEKDQLAVLEQIDEIKGMLLDVRM